jgi:electron transport complex protein RnfD
MEPNLIVSPAPHIRFKATTSRIMLDVIISLLPAFFFAVYVFGPRAALVTGVCVISCVFFEWAFEKILKRKNTINDLSAVITGMLLAYNLPVTIPVWQAVFGSFTAIILVKQLYGGLGKNFANPAITARIVMFLAFPVTMTTWAIPFARENAVDMITGATPLALLFKGQTETLATRDLFLGFHGGCLGEVSELALLLGGLYLIIRRVISWHTPVSFIAVVFALTALAGVNPIHHIFSGGLFLGAIFMATDYVTTPQTNLGRAIFGIGCGLLTVLIRLFGSYPEGVSFSILIMNTLVPFINKFTYKKALGGLKA